MMQRDFNKNLIQISVKIYKRIRSILENNFEESPEEIFLSCFKFEDVNRGKTGQNSIRKTMNSPRSTRTATQHNKVLRKIILR